MELVARAIQPALTASKYHLLYGRGELIYLTKTRLVKVPNLAAFDHCLHHHERKKLQERASFFSIHNGMGHTDEDFIRLVKKISASAQENQLIVNIYNPSVSRFHDARFVAMQKMNFSTEKVDELKTFIPELISYFSYLSKAYSYTHIAHSEAGIICDNALRALHPITADLVRKHMDVATIGSPRPVSYHLAKSAVNFYSEADYLILPFVKVFEQEKIFEFKELKSRSLRDQKHFQFIDHSLEADTYFETMSSILKQEPLA